MKKVKFIPLDELIHLDVYWNPNTSTINYGLRINPNYSLNDISKLLTKEIFKRSDESKNLKRQSDVLMDIRSMIAE